MLTFDYVTVARRLGFEFEQLLEIAYTFHYGHSSALRVFHDLKKFRWVSDACDVDREVSQFMANLNALKRQWNPSEQEYYRKLEALKLFSQEYIEYETTTKDYLPFIKEIADVLMGMNQHDMITTELKILNVLMRAEIVELDATKYVQTVEEGN